MLGSTDHQWRILDALKRRSSVDNMTGFLCDPSWPSVHYSTSRVVVESTRIAYLQYNNSSEEDSSLSISYVPSTRNVWLIQSDFQSITEGISVFQSVFLHCTIK